MKCAVLSGVLSLHSQHQCVAAWACFGRVNISVGRVGSEQRGSVGSEQRGQWAAWAVSSVGSEQRAALLGGAARLEATQIEATQIEATQIEATQIETTQIETTQLDSLTARLEALTAIQCTIRTAEVVWLRSPVGWQSPSCR